MRKILILIFTVVISSAVYLFYAYQRVYYYIGSAMLLNPFSETHFTVGAFQQGSKPLKYIAIGDSLTAGVGSDTPEHTIAYKYAQHLSETKKTNIEVINLGQPGATTTDVINNQLIRAVSENPDYITVLIGINDIHAKRSEDAFSKNYQYIMHELLTKTNSNIRVINLPYIGSPQLVYFPVKQLLNFRTQQFNGIISSIVQSGDRVKVIDLYGGTYKPMSESADLYSTDLYHPSADGYEVWSKIINDL